MPTNHSIYRLIYITTADRNEAARIGKSLVESRLAACVNIIEGMHSIYWWEGKIEESDEAVLIAKTTTDKESALIEKVKAIHSYRVPAIVCLPILGGNADYIEWIEQSLL